MATRFSAQVSTWARKSERRMTAIFRESVQRTINDAQTPVAKGGRMPVDTGFLRNSMTASLSGLPVGPSVRGEGQGNPDDVVLVIAGAKIGDIIWAGWAAEYSPFMESRYGFREAAVQKWPSTVRNVTRDLRARIR